jgi:hypothetical protein
LAYKSKNSQLKILVLGYIVRGPLGGMAWHHMQYVLGLHQMGHQVYYLEDSGDDLYCCYNPASGANNEDPAYGINFIENFFSSFELNERWIYYDKHQDKWYGKFSEAHVSTFTSFDMLINLSCSNPIRNWLEDIPLKILVDTDPVFSQIRNLNDPKRMALAQRHNAFFTFGENFGTDSCTIPGDGFSWEPTRQPVVMNAWPFLPGQSDGKFTTVMQWESYASQEFNGQFFGQKSESFFKFMTFPNMTSAKLEIAVGGASAPKKTLKENGWEICNPLEIASDPWKYQEYLQKSKGEFSVSKHGYVVSNSGWFSERSAAYLASGRPVVLEDTGFSKWIETGKGVISFRTPEEAMDGIKLVNMDYKENCRRARILAEEYFNASSVLTKLIEHAMINK